MLTFLAVLKVVSIQWSDVLGILTNYHVLRGYSQNIILNSRETNSMTKMFNTLTYQLPGALQERHL